MGLPLTSVRLVLVHITTTKLPDLQLVPIGQAYVPVCTSTLANIDALPDALKAQPYRDELDEADDLHDDFHESGQGYIDSALLCPAISKDDKTFLAEVRAVFLAEAGERSATFVNEADKARERRAKLPAYEVKLKAWTVAPGQSLHDWIDGYIAAGEKLHTLLEKRADVLSQSRKDARILRSKALGILRDLRRSIRRAVELDPALPRDLEARIFGYMDTLSAMIKSKPAEKDEPGAPQPNEGGGG